MGAVVFEPLRIKALQQQWKGVNVVGVWLKLKKSASEYIPGTSIAHALTGADGTYGVTWKTTPPPWAPPIGVVP
jgi:hypothetical protein